MTTYYGDKATDVFNTNPPVKVSPAAHGGRVRIVSDTITYDSQASGSDFVIGGGRLPIGAQVLGGYIVTSASTGSATLAVGISGSTGKYKAAGAVTTANAPQWFGVAAGLLTPVTTEEQLLVTVAADALPASGTLHVVLLYALD